jgi:hypothetical protein
MARGIEREAWSIAAAIVSGKIFTSHDTTRRKAQAALQALEEGGMVVVPRTADLKTGAVRAGMKVMERDGMTGIAISTTIDTYEAMIAASQDQGEPE